MPQLLQRSKGVLLGFILLSALSGPSAQKIGYVNSEILLWYMPGYLGINDTLSSMQSKFQEKLEVKQRYAKSLLEEYYTGRSVMRPEQIQKMEEQLAGLNTEIEKMVRDSESLLEWNRRRLQFPYFKKLDSVAALISRDMEYRYILNYGNSTTVPNILFGPEEHNLMPAFAGRLGFVLPENYLEAYQISQKAQP
jgi:Skp family chaperone for outer membrane proteins